MTITLTCQHDFESIFDLPDELIKTISDEIINDENLGFYITTDGEFKFYNFTNPSDKDTKYFTYDVDLLQLVFNTVDSCEEKEIQIDGLKKYLRLFETVIEKIKEEIDEIKNRP